MPEIVEIKKYTDELKKQYKNKTINKIAINNGRYKNHGPPNNFNNLHDNLPLKIVEIKSKGKFIYFILENNYSIGMTLGLSGGFMNSDKLDIIDKTPETQANITLHINISFYIDNTVMYFYDPLSYGTMTIFINEKELNDKLKKIGNDILDDKTTFDVFYSKLTKSKNMEKDICVVLMDQTVISGIGNYLRSEILWLSQINPFKKVNKLLKDDINKIYIASKKIIWNLYNYKQGIKRGYIVKSDKFPEDYKREFFVYKQDKDIFDNKIKQKKIKDRIVYYV